MNEKRFGQMLDQFKQQLLKLFKKNQEDTMLKTSDVLDSMSKSVAQSELVLTFILSQNQIIINLNAAVASSTGTLDPAIGVQIDALNAETAKLHDAIAGGGVIPPVLPTAAQLAAFNVVGGTPSASDIAAFTALNPAPTAAQIAAYSALTAAPTAAQVAAFVALTSSANSPIFPTDAQVATFTALNPAPTAAQIARYKTNNLTHAEEVQFNVYPTSEEIADFNRAIPAPTADQVSRFKSNQLTATELAAFRLNG